MAKDKPVSEEEEVKLEEPKEEKQEPESQEPEQLETPQEEELSEEEEGPEEAPEPMSKRKAERLAKLENLVSHLKGSEKTEAPAPKGMDYRADLQADDETVERLEADRKAAADSSFQQGLEWSKANQFHMGLKIDAPRVESKYPIFDQTSTDFNPTVSNAINQWYLTTVGFVAGDKQRGIPDKVQNADLSYSTFVDGIMELADSMAGEKVETTKKNLASQAAKTGLRPDGSTAKMNLNKAPEQMTDAELKAVISQAIK